MKKITFTLLGLILAGAAKADYAENHILCLSMQQYCPQVQCDPNNAFLNQQSIEYCDKQVVVDCNNRGGVKADNGGGGWYCAQCENGLVPNPDTQMCLDETWAVQEQRAALCLYDHGMIYAPVSQTKWACTPCPSGFVPNYSGLQCVPNGSPDAGIK